MLYNSIRYLKDELELSQHLRRTVQSVESILQSLDDFVALHRQQQLSASLPNFLPDAVNHEIISIKAELHALSTLLPTSSSSSQLRRRLKWVLDRKKVAEVIQSLDRHQITLIFALQSFAPRNGISVHEDLSRRLDQILRQHEGTARNLDQELDSLRTGLHAKLDAVTQTCGKSPPALEHLNTRLENLHGLVSAGQIVASDNLDAIGASLSHVRSSIVLAAPTEDVLARVFRAELRRVIITTVEQCLQKSKANPDSQLDEIRRKIDEMTQQLGSKSGGDVRDNVIPTNNALEEVSNVHTHDLQEAADLAASSQSLLQLRGFTLSIANTQDQRGYYQTCPSISTFAVIPKSSEVMIFALSNNVDGIQNLFKRRLAAPSDRDELGMTPLMRAAFAGATEACRLLLSEGSDPLATDEDGWDPFHWTNSGFFLELYDGNLNKKHYEVVKLLQQAEIDVMEDSPTSQQVFLLSTVPAQHKEGRFEQQINSGIAYIQWLKELGFRLDNRNGGSTVLRDWIGAMQHSNWQLSRGHIRRMLRTMLGVGADICTAESYGFPPLHFLFFYWDNSTEVRLHNLFEIATALLQNGADPYALTSDGDSAFDLAEYVDFTSVFLEALEQAGYDINEVRREIDWRQWCFDNPGHGFGESTAVDDTQIAAPSTKGLVLRRAVRGDRLED
ncbi:MAG: hypothetical protein Q9196_000251 [Gyalolechia fulgens]